MKLLIPFQMLLHFVNEDPSKSHKIFWGCIFLAILKGWAWGKEPDSYFWKEIFNDSSGLWWEALFRFVKTFYSKPGFLIMALLSFFLFLWLIYKLSGANKKLDYSEFILPFLGLAVIGFPLHGFGIIFHLINVPLPSYFAFSIVLFVLIFYCFLLNKKFEINLLRSIVLIFGLFLPTLILGGLPGFAPYLIWL